MWVYVGGNRVGLLEVERATISGDGEDASRHIREQPSIIPKIIQAIR